MQTIAIVITAQFILTFVVIVVLKKLWDRELIRAAIEKFEGQPASEEVKLIAVSSASAINDAFKARIEEIRGRKFRKADLDIRVDPGLKGGVVITVDGQELDYSLSSR